MIIKDNKLTGWKKRQRHFKDMHARSGLNLVSLMDIFTILVFFLLVNSGSQQLPNAKDVKLPTSVSSKVPAENLVLAITKNSIVVAGRKVADLSAVLNDKSTLIPDLVKELNFQAEKFQLYKQEKNKLHSVTIMGDENTPYKVLSKVLATCRAANYTQISFAAYHRNKDKG